MKILISLMHFVVPIVEHLVCLAHVVAPFVVVVEIVVLTIHFRERRKERADRERRKEMRKRDEARKQETDGKLAEPARLCPACPAPCRRDQTLGIAA